MKDKEKCGRCKGEKEVLIGDIQKTFIMKTCPACKGTGLKPEKGKREIKHEIIVELQKVINKLTDDPEILSVVGSYNDTLDDKIILSMLKTYNRGEKVLKEYD